MNPIDPVGTSEHTMMRRSMERERDAKRAMKLHIQQSLLSFPVFSNQRENQKKKIRT